MNKEKDFYDVLESVFIGVPIEGRSGYVNLLRIKSQYYQSFMKPRLQKFIDEKLEEFPEFREELFRKLYTFFKRYFSEAGVLGLYSTPYHESLYERVYPEEAHEQFIFSPENKTGYERLYDENDVTLFWKTSRMYYVKTDRLFRSMSVDIEGIRFYFDASEIQHKKSNEKKTLVYRVVSVENDVNEESQGWKLRVAISVQYEGANGSQQASVLEEVQKVSDSEGRSKLPSSWTTDVDDLYEVIRSHASGFGVKVSVESVEKAVRAFVKQAEVDYFICKDTRKFLREQFDLWMYQYIFSKMGENVVTQFSERRLAELRVLKLVAYEVIEMIAGFEDELVKIWNKPKFVLDSHYVITLDRIWGDGTGDGRALLHDLLNHPGMESQVTEWRELGMVEDDFDTSKIIVSNLLEEELDARYRSLPLDTKYFPDLELRILSLFDNLDEALDGWLIKSENYQALNTLLPRFRQRVDCIYIDPPYNRDRDEFIYVDRFRHSTWLTMMENRLELARSWMGDHATIFISTDDIEQANVRKLGELVFGEDNFVNNIIWQKKFSPQNDAQGLSDNHDFLVCFSRDKRSCYLGVLPRTAKQNNRYKNPDNDPRGPWMSSGLDVKRYTPEYDYEIKTPSGRIVRPPKGSCWRVLPERFQELVEDNRIWFGADGDGVPRLKRFLSEVKQGVTPLTIWEYKEVGHNQEAKQELKDMLSEGSEVFQTPKPVRLIERVLSIGMDAEGTILDFFSGSGTTAVAAIRLNQKDGGSRRYILVEMAHYFDTILLPRIKRAVFSDLWEDGKAKPGGRGASHFFKYFELEQFEDVLREAHYADNENPPPGDPVHYLFFGDHKLLHGIDLDYQNNRVVLNLDNLYKGRKIDIAQTLSYLTGKSIKRISEQFVVFSDGAEIRYDQIPDEYLRRLLWW